MHYRNMLKSDTERVRKQLFSLRHVQVGVLEPLAGGQLGMCIGLGGRDSAPGGDLGRAYDRVQVAGVQHLGERALLGGAVELLDEQLLPLALHHKQLGLLSGLESLVPGGHVRPLAVLGGPGARVVAGPAAAAGLGDGGLLGAGGAVGAHRRPRGPLQLQVLPRKLQLPQLVVLNIAAAVVTTQWCHLPAFDSKARHKNTRQVNALFNRS
eukprot:scaffold526863_cov46-Prasinocladus_malaysianus.AAC.1